MKSNNLFFGSWHPLIIGWHPRTRHGDETFCHLDDFFLSWDTPTLARAWQDENIGRYLEVQDGDDTDHGFVRGKGAVYGSGGGAIL